MHYLHQAWQFWKRLGRALGDFIGRLFLTVFYFTVFAPFGAAVRWLSDPLRLKSSHDSSFWLNRDATDQILESARRQF